MLYPWSDGRQDLQLGLVLMLISSCSSDPESLAEFGLEAVTQQVGVFVEGGCRGAVKTLNGLSFLHTARDGILTRY